jgi:hypothetical protein
MLLPLDPLSDAIATLAGFELVLESPFTDHPQVSGGAAACISVLIKISSCLL